MHTATIDRGEGGQGNLATAPEGQGQGSLCAHCMCGVRMIQRRQ
jgi:hypothetical protein